MPVKKRWALRFLLLVTAALSAVVLVLRTEWTGRQVCTQGSRILTRLAGEPIVLGRCSLDPLFSALTIENVRVGPAEAPRFTARRLLVDLAPLAFGSALSLDRIELDEPVVSVDVGRTDDKPDTERSEDCLSLLDRVKVGAVRINGAALRLGLPDGEVRIDGLGLAVDRTLGAYAAKLDVAGGSFDSGATRVELDGLAAKVRLDGEDLAVDELKLASSGAAIEADGRLRSLCKPVLDLHVRAKSELAPVAARFAPGLADVAGRAEIGLEITGPSSAPLLRAEVALHEVAFDEFDLGEVTLRASLAGEELDLEELVWPVADGRAIVSGELALRDDFPVRVEVRTEALPFERLLAKLPIKNTPVQMTIDSEHQLAGHLKGFFLEGQSALEIRHFRVRNVPWHAKHGRTIVEIPSRATLQTAVRLDASGIVLDPARAGFGPGTSLLFSSRLGFSEQSGLTIRATSPHFDLAHINAHVAGIPLGGAGEITAYIDGPYPSPMIEGDLDLLAAKLFSAELGHLKSHVVSRPADGSLDFSAVEGQHGVTRYDADVKLVVGGDPTIDGRISLREGGRLGDLFGATANLVTPLAWLRDHLDGTLRSANATVKGPLPGISAEGSVRARGVTLMERPFDELSADLRVPDITRMELDKVEVTRGPGKANATGTIFFSQRPSIDAAIEGKGLPLRDLLGSFAEWADLDGGAGARARILGPVDDLDISGELFAEKVRAKGVKLPQTRLSLETQGGAVIVRGPVCRAGMLSAAVRLEEGLPYDASFQIDVPELRRYLPKELQIGGEVQGTATASGTLASLTTSRGSIDLEKLALFLGGDYRVESQGPVSMTYSGPAFVLYGMNLRGENTELSLYGNRAADGELDLQAHGSFDARLLDSLVPQIEHTTGVVEIRAAVTGDAANPVLVGSAEVSRGAFRVKALPLSVSRLNGTLAFSQNQVVVEDATLTANGGRGRIRGTVSLKDWAPDVFDLSMQGERMSWRKPVDWPAVVSGRLHLGGSWPQSLLLSGELDVDRLRYTKDLELEKAMLDFRRRVSQPPGPGDVERIRLDIDLVGGPDMRVDNNLVRTRLQFVAPPGGRSGRLKLIGSNVRLGLLGAVEVDGIAFFRGNEYRITHGVVELKERDRIDPEFDITAETEVREYSVLVHLFGRLEDESGSGYQLELQAEPTLAQADIVSLLTFGITSRDLDRGGSSAAAGAGVAAEALLVVSGLDEHVNRWIPDTELVMDPELSVTSQYSEITGQVEPMAVFEAKLLTDSLRLKAAAPFSTTKGRRASAELKVNEKLSTQVIWENEETGFSAGDLGMDVKLRWEWE